LTRFFEHIPHVTLRIPFSWHTCFRQGAYLAHREQSDGLGFRLIIIFDQVELRRGGASIR
jgi:hypothetical protein